MNVSARKLATALAVSILATTGAASAATPDAQSETTPQAAPVTGQSPGLAIPPAPNPSATMPTPAASGTPSNTMPGPGTTTPSAAGTGTSTTPAAGATQNAQARKIFDQLDTNHDGVLSFEEFSRATFETK